MARDTNFFSRALEALVAGRTRSAQRYVAQFDRDYGKLNARLTKR